VAIKNDRIPIILIYVEMIPSFSARKSSARPHRTRPEMNTDVARVIIQYIGPSAHIFSLISQDFFDRLGCRKTSVTRIGTMFHQNWVNLLISQFTPGLTKLSKIAAQYANMPLLFRLHSMQVIPLDQTYICLYAARGGHRHVIEWARRRGMGWDCSTVAAAARHGHFELLKWLKGAKCPWSLFTSKKAALSGHLGAFSWSWSLNGSREVSEHCVAAASRGHIEILDHILCTNPDYPVQIEYQVVISAIQSRRYSESLATIEWLTSRGFPTNSPEYIRKAAEVGRYDLFMWFVNRRCIIHDNTAFFAAKAGCLEILKWIHNAPAFQTQFHSDVFLAAVKTNDSRLELAQWLFGANCPWDEKTWITAVRHGDIDLIEWLYRNFPRNLIDRNDTISAGIHSKSLTILQLLNSWFSFTIQDLSRLCRDAAVLGNLSILKWAHSELIRRQCPIRSLGSIVSLGLGVIRDVEFLRSLKELGFVIDNDTLTRALRHEYLPTIVWLGTELESIYPSNILVALQSKNEDIRTWGRGKEEESLGLMARKLIEKK
jgi:hypothetical protein